MANASSKKPVNDLIKFWAEKQEKNHLEPVSRSLRRPLFPNASLPTTPLNETFSSKAPFRDIPSNSPPSTPTKPSNNIHSLISEGNDNSVNNNNSLSDIPTLSLSRSDSPNEEISRPISPPPPKNIYKSRPRDLVLNMKDVHNKSTPVRKVTDLVNKFEKVTSPTNSVSTSPRLTPMVQTFPVSEPRFQLTPEPLSLPSPLNSKEKRRQTVPEPLTISSLRQISDEPTLISPISPIENKKTSPSTERCVPEIQPQKKPVQQESLSNQPVEPKKSAQQDQSVQPKKPVQQESLFNQSVQPQKKLVVQQESIYNQSVQPQKKLVVQQEPTSNQSVQPQKKLVVQQESISNQSNNNNNTPTQKKVSELNPNPVKILSIKQSDSEPIHVQPKQTQSASPTIQSDYLDFLSETLQSFQTTSFNSNLWNPENVNKTVPEKKQNKTFTNRNITKVTFETPSKPINNKSKINYEIPDLLPQPEPISPIKLTFSDFIISPNGTSTNLNLNDKQDGENEKSDFLDMMSTKQFDNVVKPEVSKKDENSSTTKSNIRPVSGKNQFIENLRRYLQPNKYKNSDIINITTRKVASQ